MDTFNKLIEHKRIVQSDLKINKISFDSLVLYLIAEHRLMLRRNKKIKGG